MKNELFFQHNNIIGEFDKLWFVSRTSPYVFEVNIEEETMHILFELDNNGYRALSRHHGQFFVYPINGNKVIKYDPTSMTRAYLDIPDNLHSIRENNWSGNCLSVGDQDLFYWSNPVITVYDTYRQSWRVLKDWRNLISEDLGETGWFGETACVYKGMIYIPITKLNRLVKIDGNTSETDCINLNDYGFSGNIRAVTTDVESMYILSGQGDSYKLYSFDGRTLSCMIEFDLLNSVDTSIYSILRASNKFIIFPKRYEKAVSINVSNALVEPETKIPAFDKEILQTSNKFSINYFAGVRINDIYFAIHPWTLSLVKVNMISGEIKTVSLTIEETEMDKIMNSYILRNPMIFEGDIDLNEFLMIEKR